MENITIDTILYELKKSAETGNPVGSGKYLDYATHINVLLQELDEQIVDVAMKVKRKKKELMEQGKSTVEAKIYAEAEEDFKHLLFLEAKKERAMEQILLCKKRVDNKFSDY